MENTTTKTLCLGHADYLSWLPPRVLPPSYTHAQPSLLAPGALGKEH